MEFEPHRNAVNFIPIPKPNLDLWPFYPKPYTICRISQCHS